MKHSLLHALFGVDHNGFYIMQIDKVHNLNSWNMLTPRQSTILSLMTVLEHCTVSNQIRCAIFMKHSLAHACAIFMKHSLVHALFGADCNGFYVM